MSYGSVGFGGLFAPDCYLAGGKADTLGAPLAASLRASYVAQFGASAGPLFDACQGSANPAECIGMNTLSKPFLGRPCKPDWMQWALSKTGAFSPSAAEPPTIAPPPEDNTVLYAGAAAAALLVVGGVYLATKKK